MDAVDLTFARIAQIFAHAKNSFWRFSHKQISFVLVSLFYFFKCHISDMTSPG